MRMNEANDIFSRLDDAARHALIEEVLNTDAARAASAAGIDVDRTLRNMMRPMRERLTFTIAAMKQHARLSESDRLAIKRHNDQLVLFELEFMREVEKRIEALP